MRPAEAAGQEAEAAEAAAEGEEAARDGMRQELLLRLATTSGSGAAPKA